MGHKIVTTAREIPPPPLINVVLRFRNKKPAMIDIKVIQVVTVHIDFECSHLYMGWHTQVKLFPAMIAVKFLNETSI